MISTIKQSCTVNIEHCGATYMWHYSKPRCFHMELVLDILYIDNTYMISHIESSNVQLAHGTHWRHVALLLSSCLHMELVLTSGMWHHNVRCPMFALRYWHNIYDITYWKLKRSICHCSPSGMWYYLYTACTCYSATYGITIFNIWCPIFNTKHPRYNVQIILVLFLGPRVVLWQHVASQWSIHDVPCSIYEYIQN